MNNEQTLVKLNEAYNMLCDALSKSSFSDSFSDYDAFKLVMVIFLHDRLVAKKDDEEIIMIYEKTPISEQNAIISDQFIEIIEKNLRKIQLQVPLAEIPTLFKEMEEFDVADTIDNVSELLSSVLNLQAYQNVLPTQVKAKIYEIFKAINANPILDEQSFIKEVLDKFTASKECMLAERGIRYIPWYVDELMVSIANPQIDEEKYLYSFGLSNISLILAFSLYKRFLYNHKIIFLVMGHDKNHDLWALALLRFAVFGNNKYTDFNQFFDTSENFHNFCDMADVIFYTPSSGSLRIKKDSMSLSEEEDEGIVEVNEIPELTYELLWALGFSRHRMVALMPATILADNDIDSVTVRRSLIDKDMLDALVVLPSVQTTPAPSKQMVLLVFKYGKPLNQTNKVLFISATPDRDDRKSITSAEMQNIVYKYNNFKTSWNDAIVSCEEIQQNNYSLSPHLYTGCLKKEIDNYKASNGKLLHDICKIIVGHQSVPDNRAKNIPVVNINNLSSNIKSPYLDLNTLSLEAATSQDPVNTNINKLEMHSAGQNIQIVKDGCILVSLVDISLKPTIYRPDESEIAIYGLVSGIALGPNVAAIIPDTSKIDFDYFYYQLHDIFVQKQHEAFFTASLSGIPHITIEGLESIVIPVPESLDVQRNITTDIKVPLIEDSNLIDYRSIERLKISINKQPTELRPDEVKKAIQSGETNRQEFKETLRYDIYQAKFDDKILPRQAVEAIASFMNANGGSLYIGVSNDKTISGIERDVHDDDTYKRYLDDKIATLLGRKDAANVNIQIIEIDGKRICIVYCPKCNDPVFMRSEKDPQKTEFWVRMAASDKELTGREMLDYINARKS